MEGSIISKNGLAYVAVAVVSLLVFLSIAEDVTDREFWSGYDTSVNSWSAAVQNSMFTPFAEFIGTVFDPVVLVVILLVMSVFLWLKDSKTDSLLFMILMLASGASVELVKLAVHRARPLDMLIAESGFSFPSGHAAMAMMLFGLVIYLGLRHLKSRRARVAVASVSSAMALIIGVSRIYLNVHWLSDVIGGYALGMFLLSAGILLLEISERKGYVQRLLSMVQI